MSAARSSCRPSPCMSRSAGHLQRRWARPRRWRRWSRRSGLRCRTTPRFRRSTRAATRWRTWPAAASSRWSSEDVRISQILTREAFENAIRVNGAIGGSTNAVIHLLAIAGRVGVPLTLEDWDGSAATCRRIVDLMPSGRFLMEDFYYAGGLPAVIRTLGEHGLLNTRRADRQRPDASGRTASDAPNYNAEVIRPFDKPLAAHGGIAVLRGNLAPHGAVLKPSAASPHLMQPSRPRRRVREHRALQGAHRRSGARRRRRLRAGAEELRPEGLSRHGGGRQHGAAAEGAADRA